MKSKNEFPLQSVLNFKASTVDALEMEFAQLKANHERQKRMLLALTVAEQQEMDVLCQQQRGELDCEDIKLRQLHLESLRRGVIEQTVRVEVAALEMETKREEMLEALKEYKTILKLRERHTAEVMKEMQRQEARVVDDIVSARYIRERREQYA
jgi:flagellar export protein FliJ